MHILTGTAYSLYWVCSEVQQIFCLCIVKIILTVLANNFPIRYSKNKGRTIIFIGGGGGGGCQFWDLQTFFFSKNNAFQTIFFIRFCNENNFL